MVAYHEAGHAVAMVLCGAGVTKIWMNPGLLYHRTVLDGEEPPPPAPGEFVEAGHAVARIWRLARNSFVHAAGTAAVREAGMVEDFYLDERLRVRAYLRSARLRSTDEAADAARRELREVWPAVQATAADLMEWGSQGREAEEKILAKIPEWRRRLIPTPTTNPRRARWRPVP